MNSGMMNPSDVVTVKVEDMEPSPWNPNVQAPGVFNQLVEEIREDGFDEPILVVENPDFGKREGAKKYRIIAGEHRWRAVRVLGHDTVAAIVKTDWDETAQKIKTVRRNMLRGELDPKKFSELVGDLEGQNIPRAEMPGLLGFTNPKEFEKLVRSIEPKQDDKLKEIIDESKREIEAIDNMSVVLNEIFAKFGQDIPLGFVFFFYRGSMHLMVNMKGRLARNVEDMVKFLRGSKREVEEFLSNAILAEIERQKWQIEGALADKIQPLESPNSPQGTG